jgi:superfamily II DNA/RNA helicase
MLNMGFIDDIEEILSHTNPSRRNILFSATMPAKIRELARKYIDGYQLLTVKKQQLTTSLTDVINYSIPQDPESYVHRIGRTGGDPHGRKGTGRPCCRPA